MTEKKSQEEKPEV